jgi:hypothetical protein
LLLTCDIIWAFLCIESRLLKCQNDVNDILNAMFGAVNEVSAFLQNHFCLATKDHCTYICMCICVRILERFPPKKWRNFGN